MVSTTGKYAGHQGTVESNVFQKSADYPDEFANGPIVMLDTERRMDSSRVCSQRKHPVVSLP